MQETCSGLVDHQHGVRVAIVTVAYLAQIKGAAARRRTCHDVIGHRLYTPPAHVDERAVAEQQKNSRC